MRSRRAAKAALNETDLNPFPFSSRIAQRLPIVGIREPEGRYKALGDTLTSLERSLAREGISTPSENR